MAAASEQPSVTHSARVEAYRACSAGERSDAIEQLGALLCAGTAELLDLISAADAERDWQLDGATGMAAWLVATLHVSGDTARAWVRVGATLGTLPHLREAFGAGCLSWDQVRPAVRFVTPDTDARHARDLPAFSAGQIEDLARQHTPRRDAHAADAGRRRFFRSRPDHTHGGRRFSGFLPDSEAARLDAVLNDAADKAGPNQETGLWDPIDARRADALVDLADTYAGLTADPDTALVVVHAPAEVIDGHVDGNGQIEDLQIPRGSILRLLCDSKVEFSIDTPDGTTIGIGRTDRTIPRWLRRRIARRDGGHCRFPGCGRRIRQIHHLHHWTNGGPTNAHNLVGLCWYHHRLVHEGHWTIHGNPDHELTFTSPHGRRLRSRPQPLRPDTRARAATATHINLT
jgi:hypothetical protein